MISLLAWIGAGVAGAAAAVGLYLYRKSGTPAPVGDDAKEPDAAAVSAASNMFMGAAGATAAMNSGAMGDGGASSSASSIT